MATKDDLDAAEENLANAITTLATDLDAAIKALKDKITGGGDLSAEVTALSKINDAVQTMDAKLQAEITPPPAA